MRARSLRVHVGHACAESPNLQKAHRIRMTVRFAWYNAKATKRSELREIMQPALLRHWPDTSRNLFGVQTCLLSDVKLHVHCEAWPRLFRGTAEKLRSVKSSVKVERIKC